MATLLMPRLPLLPTMSPQAPTAGTVNEQSFAPQAYQSVFDPSQIDAMTLQDAANANAQITQPIVTSSNTPTVISSGISTTEIVLIGSGVIAAIYFLKKKRG